MKLEETLVRQPVLDDISDIVRLCSDHAAYENSEIGFDNDTQATELTRLMFQKPVRVHCLVIVKSKLIIGYTTFMKQFSTWSAKPYLYIDCLFIEKEHRGLGLGRLVFQRLADEACEMGCEQLQWQTPESNVRAIEFYQRLGGDGRSKIRFSWNPQEIYQK